MMSDIVHLTANIVGYCFAKKKDLSGYCFTDKETSNVVIVINANNLMGQAT